MVILTSFLMFSLGSNFKYLLTLLNLQSLHNFRILFLPLRARGLCHDFPGTDSTNFVYSLIFITLVGLSYIFLADMRECSGNNLPKLSGMEVLPVVKNLIYKVTCPEGQEFFSGDPAKIIACENNNWTSIYDQCGPREYIF